MATPHATIPLAEAPRLVCPPRDDAVVPAIACEVVDETQVPWSRQARADVTDRAGTAWTQPSSRSTVWRRRDAEARTPWRDT